MDRFMTVTKQTYAWPPYQKPIKHDAYGPINVPMSGPIIEGVNDWFVEGNIPKLHKDIYPEEIKPSPAMLVKMRQNPGCVCWKGQIPRLKDPAIYPSRVGAAPEVDTSRYDQPNTYLRLLYEKYPYLYNVLQHVPSEEILEQLKKDTLLTTYQVDFSIKAPWPANDKEREELLQAAQMHKRGEHYTATEMPKRIFRPRLKDPMIAEKLLHGDTKGSGKERQSDSEVISLVSEDPFETIYQKEIGKLGCEIIRHKIHKKEK